MDTDFVPTLKFKTKLWVWLPDGQYFYLHVGQSGVWYQMYALHMDYPSQAAAMEAALNYVLAPNTYGPEKYRKMRFKEQVFSFTPAWKKKRKKYRCPTCKDIPGNCTGAWGACSRNPKHTRKRTIN